MAKIITVIFILSALLVSCKKDKVPPPCTGVSMTGDRELFVGKWRWYKTRIEEWFDIGPSNYYDYTPQNQGFEYYFTLSSEGLFKGYRNDTLVHDLILNEVDYENFSGSNIHVIQLNIDCSSSTIDLRKYTSNVTNDSIHTLKYPYNFNDQENHLKSHGNYFVRE